MLVIIMYKNYFNKGDYKWLINVKYVVWVLAR